MSPVERLTSWMYCGGPEESLPLDLIGPVRDMCLAHWRGWRCTRRVGHTGRHAAGALERFVAVWPEGEDAERGAEV